jgi:hypothetical protein
MFNISFIAANISSQSFFLFSFSSSAPQKFSRLVPGFRQLVYSSAMFRGIFSSQVEEQLSKRTCHHEIHFICYAWLLKLCNSRIQAYCCSFVRESAFSGKTPTRNVLRLIYVSCIDCHAALGLAWHSGGVL